MPGTSTLVVIPTLDEAKHIRSVIGTLLPQIGADDRIVVSDGGSRDGTQDIVRVLVAEDSRIALIDNPARIQSAGINLAVTRFGDDHDVLIRCDAHSIYPADFVPALLASLRSSEAASVVVPMDAIGESCVGRAIAWVSDTPMGSGGSAHRGGLRSRFVDHGHHAAMRLDWFRKVDGYEPTFSHNEDAELDCRLRAYGARIFLDADIRLTYVARPTLGALWRQYRKYGFGRSRTLRRHPGSLKLRQFAVPSFVLANLLCLLLALAVHPLFLLLPVAYGLALGVGAIGIALRRKSLCGLFAAPAAFTMHIAWALGLIEGFLTKRERRWQAA